MLMKIGYCMNKEKFKRQWLPDSHKQLCLFELLQNLRFRLLEQALLLILAQFQNLKRSLTLTKLLIILFTSMKKKKI